MTDVLLVSPMSGWCASLDDNPDPVFSGRLLGDGVSIDPTDGEVRAPCDATVASVAESRHAVNLRTANGAELLIHVGVDTMALQGEGFDVAVREGDVVSAGQPLLHFDIEHVLRHAPSLRTPVILMKHDNFGFARVAADGPIRAGDPLFRIVAAARPADAAASADWDAAGFDAVERTVVVGLEHGVHARPAALLASAMENVAAVLELVNADGRRANAGSPVSLMTLGVRHRDTVTLVARGPDADASIAAIAPLLEPLGDAPRESRTPAAGGTGPAADAPPPGTRLPGKVASAGLASGTAVRLQMASSLPPPPRDRGAGSVAEEAERLDTAIGTVSTYYDTLGACDDPLRRDLASTHRAMVNDAELLRAARQKIQAGRTADAAWHAAVEERVDLLGRLDDRRMRERVDDLADIGTRVLRVLSGEEPNTTVTLPDDAIVIADNLLPSQLLQLGADRLGGVCLAAGGTTSHVAILATATGLPMLVAMGDGILTVPDGCALLMDARLGEVHVAPTRGETAEFQRRIAADEREQQAALASAGDACITADGVRIDVLANLASVDDAETAAAHGADGCGLLRTEFLFMDSAAPPSVAEQRQAYRAIAGHLHGKPVTVRTLDAGSDKPLSYVHQDAEDNPALGLRGIRLSLAERGLLEAQFDALLDVQPVKIMLPMVSAVGEVLEARAVLESVAVARGIDGDVELGVMIETPAAALSVDVLAEHADFFSIGTNDLTQYTLGMDRGLPALAQQMDSLHPAVLRLVDAAARAARAAGKPISVCGNAAGDPVAAPVLIGLGIRQLSLAPVGIPLQKAVLRRLSFSVCEQLARRALDCASAGEVRELAARELGRGPEDAR